VGRPYSTPAGIYLHWPFCERKCPYCDFYTFGREHPFAVRRDAYLAALLAEIETAPERLSWPAPPRVDTIYLGGGTPSLIGAEALGKLLGTLSRHFTLEPDTEITLEVNPTTAEAAGLEELLALGINRLSVGCQSFNDRVLHALGRVHDAATTRRAIALMRSLGVRNLSLDLIFGAPTQTMEDFASDLREILSFSPEHVSAYNLTIHDSTPFARWEREGRLGLPAEETQVAMFEHLIDTLAGAGYEHYEISNWARPGLASRHNSKYWQACDVYGFGVAAHGVRGGWRTANPPDLNQYLNPDSRRLAVALDPPLSERARCGEIMMLALRRTGGVGWAEINDWMGREARDFYRPELERLLENGLVECPEHSLCLSRRGILLADSVMEAFF
jgi:oxygen-independent coproporphyrinogen-3 oxidase